MDKELEKLQAEYDEAVKRRRTLLALGDDLTEKQAEELEQLNDKAAKMTARISAIKADIKAQEEEKERHANELKEAVAKAELDARTRYETAQNRLETSDAPYAAKYKDESKYDNLDNNELSVFIDVANAFKRSGRDVNVPYAAYKALARRVSQIEPDKAKDKETKAEQNYIKNSFAEKVGFYPKNEDVFEDALKNGAFKAATDPMYTAGSLVGSDWVGTNYSTSIWERIRADNPIISRVPSEVIPDGYSNETIPLESTDPTWYRVSEASASDGTLKVPAATVTASQMATANKNITVGKLGARVLYTKELTEDSLIRVVPQLTKSIQLSGMDTLESAIIDGDVETSANKNINDIAGTPASTDYFLIFDGFRKLALVTNTGNSRSAGGGFVVSDYKETARMLGTAGLGGSSLQQTLFIQDFNVRWASMDLAETLTSDVFKRAVLENGSFPELYGYQIATAYNMHKVSVSAGYERKANTAGKIDVDTGSNNTTGSLLAVRLDQWMLKYKRRFTIETTRIANADSWEIVAFARVGLGYRDVEASAITYNIGV